MSATDLGPRYRRIFAAATISNLGDGVFVVALPLVAAELTRDPRAVAGVSLALGLPWLLFALVAGALVDRWDRRVVMVVADLVRSVVVGGLALAVLTDSHTIELLYLVAFMLGTAETMFDNASQTILPSVVSDPEDLPRANGRLYAAETVTNQFLGPPLGGVLVAAAASVPFWVDAASFLAASLLVLSMRGRFRAPGRVDVAGARRSLGAEIGEGVTWLWHHRLLRDLAVMLLLMNLWTMAGFSVLVLFAQEELGLGEIGFGLLLIAPAVGSVIGGLVTSRVVARTGAGPVLAFGAFGIAIAHLLIAPLSDPWLVGAVLGLTGLAGTGWNVVTVSLRQSVIPDELLGRVNSVYRFLGWGGMPVGALIGGLLAARFGLRAPFWVGGAVMLAAALVLTPGFTTRAVDEARGRTGEPAPTG